MPYWKKAISKRTSVYYPHAIVQGEPVETKDLAEELAFVSTVSKSDVNAVLGDIARVMNTFMANGKSVHIDGLGYFRYVLDTKGVGKLMEMAVKLGKAERPALHCGICGEHGGDPSSIEFCHKIGLNYVSCSPYRVPIARLAAAQANIRNPRATK